MTVWNNALKLLVLLAIAGLIKQLAPASAGVEYLLPIIGMANETTTTTLTELVRREMYAGSQLYFAEKPGIADFVAFKGIPAGEPTLTARFPIYDKLSAGAIAENTDYTTNSALDTTGSVDVTVSEHAMKFIITRLSLGATVDDLVSSVSPGVMGRAKAEGGKVGQIAAEAIQRLQDQDLAALFGSFNSSTGSNSGPMTTTLFLNAIRQLDIDNIPSSPRVCVMAPRQWHDILPALDDASVFGAQGQEIVATGVVGRVYGVVMFQTGNVATATVSSSTVYAGAVMHPDAAALAEKGMKPELEAESDASLRAIEIVATGVWGEAEYRGGATTSGRGGAGVYLYSNTTS